MKIHIVLLIAIISLISSLLFGENQVAIGDSEIDVRNKMGKPSGIITIGKNEKIMSYSNGDIILKDGKVSKLEFLPPGKSYSEMNKKSADTLQQRIAFDKSLFNQPLNKFTESQEYKELSDPEKIAKLKEFKDSNPNVDISDLVKALEKKIADFKAKDPAAAKAAAKAAEKEAAEAAATANSAPVPTTPKFQGAEPNPYPSGGSGYPTGSSSGASSGGYNFQQNDFYKSSTKTNAPAKPTQ